MLKTSVKLIEPVLKAVVLELAMLFPVTLSDSELARRPESEVENEKPIISS